MPVIQKFTEGVAVGAVVENVLAGSAFEFANSNQIVSIGVVANAVDTFVTIQIGTNIVLEESASVVKITFPVIPDEMYYQDVASQGDRIVIRVRNASAATRDFRTIVQTTPIR